MKHLVLFITFVAISILSIAQTVHTTARSGNYSANNTWVGGGSGKPVSSGNCNCVIRIKQNHTLTLDNTMTLGNVSFVLEGSNSTLTFGGLGNDLTLTGNSSIDIWNSSSDIVPGLNFFTSNVITLGGETIYNSSSTKFPASAPTGTVRGPASASSARTTPQWFASTLPVALSDFKLSGMGNRVALSWTTSTEINSSHFEIERSSDGKTWNTIGKVAASGNISVDKNYSFSDGAPSNGSNYYRLKIVDIDAKYEYSPIKTISFTVSSLTLVAGPNPATSTLNVTVNQPGDEPFRLRLINRAGQVVYDQKYASSSNRLQLNVSNYIDGTYFLEVSNTSGLRQLSKVMIVRK